MSQEGAVSCMDPRNWIPCNYYNRLVRFLGILDAGFRFWVVLI